jgi:3-hydroxyacyl-[acyl-carrier-protein] dehydratase
MISEMTLQDNLFTIVSQQQEEGLDVFHVRLNPEWPIYKAHFPGHPITPGVCIVQMVQELLQVLLHRELRLYQAKNVKYVSIVSPDDVLDLTVTFSKIEEQPGGSLKVQAQVANGEMLFTKLSVTFE